MQRETILPVDHSRTTSFLRQQVLETLIVGLLEAKAENRRRNESQDDLLELLQRLEEDRRRSKEECRQAEQQTAPFAGAIGWCNAERRAPQDPQARGGGVECLAG